MDTQDILQRVGVRHRTGHHVAVNGALCKSGEERGRTLSRAARGHLLHAENALRLQLEERLVGEQADVVLALGAGATQTRSLTSAHEDQRDLVLGDGIQCNGEILVLLLLGQLVRERDLCVTLHLLPCIIHGVQFGILAGSSRLFHGRLVDQIQTLEIDLAQLEGSSCLQLDTWVSKCFFSSSVKRPSS